MYAAQFKHKMLEDLPEFDRLVAEGKLLPIKEWLTKNIHQYGKLKKPLEILQDVTGEGLNPNYLIDYLYEKYERVYLLN
jgi:carboxypeptidase Taq